MARSKLVRFSPGAIEWLRSGRRGISSEAIFEAMTGVPVGGHRLTHPLDPSDLGRCRELLAAVPEFQRRLDEMREVSPQWRALVGHWDELCALQDEERARRVPGGSTYERMCELTEGTHG